MWRSASTSHCSLLNTQTLAHAYTANQFKNSASFQNRNEIAFEICISSFTHICIAKAYSSYAHAKQKKKNSNKPNSTTETIMTGCILHNESKVHHSNNITSVIPEGRVRW